MKSAEIRKVIKVLELMKTWDESDPTRQETAAYNAAETKKYNKYMDKMRTVQGEVPKDRDGERKFARNLKEKVRTEMGLKTAEMGPFVQWDEQDIIRLIRLIKN